MKRAILATCVISGGYLTLTAPAFAAGPVTAGPVAAGGTCLVDLRALSTKMQTGGYWLGGSDAGYGYPVGGYGYGYNYPFGGAASGTDTGYQTTRPGYEVRTLMAAANVLQQNNQQQACEDVLATATRIYTAYAAELANGGVAPVNDAQWRKQQIAAAVPVTDKTAAARSGDILDTDVRNASDDSLGSVHDIVISPQTGKIAYLIISRGGIFGFDASYVPVPWADFKVTPNDNLIVLDSTPAAMTSAPQVTDAEFKKPGAFDARSKVVDAYWKTHLASAASN